MYSSSPVSTPSFKTLAQMLFRYLSDKIPLCLSEKGHSSGTTSPTDKKTKQTMGHFIVRPDSTEILSLWEGNCVDRSIG